MRVHRRPAVAGAFYESDPERLRQQIKRCYEHKLGPGRLPSPKQISERTIIGLLVPHAGYMYSGPVACHSYAALAGERKPDTAVILGPNHTGMGSGVSVQTEGEWLTPLGRVEIDEKTAREITKKSRLLEEDEAAHENEHSVEVQVPMLQYLFANKIRIVPIVIMLQYADVCRELSSAIAEAVKGKNIVIIASSDFTHYESAETAHAKDKHALGSVEKIDGESLLEIVERHNISMCGPAPVATMLMATRQLGATSSQILKYATSGDVTGDMEAVVGYGAARISFA